MTRVLFVSHTATVSGAELVLADAVQPWRGASAFLFEGKAISRASCRSGVASFGKRATEPGLLKSAAIVRPWRRSPWLSALPD